MAILKNKSKFNKILSVLFKVCITITALFTTLIFVLACIGSCHSDIAKADFEPVEGSTFTLYNRQVQLATLLYAYNDEDILQDELLLLPSVGQDMTMNIILDKTARKITIAGSYGFFGSYSVVADWTSSAFAYPLHTRLVNDGFSLAYFGNMYGSTVSGTNIINSGMTYADLYYKFYPNSTAVSIPVLPIGFTVRVPSLEFNAQKLEKVVLSRDYNYSFNNYQIDNGNLINLKNLTRVDYLYYDINGNTLGFSYYETLSYEYSSTYNYDYSETLYYNQIVEDLDEYNEGYNAGWLIGFNAGADVGANEINQNSYDKGYNKGLEDGKNIGYSEGVIDGSLNGQDLYEQGYNEGREVGQNEGYNLGFQEGASNQLTSASFFTRVFNIFDIPIFGFISLGGIFKIIFVLSIGIWALKVLAGG